MCLKRVSRSRKQIKHFVRKPKPFKECRAFALVTRRPYCPGRSKELCFTTPSLAVKTVGARLGVVKQSYLGLPGQYGRRVTRRIGFLLETPFGASILFFRVTYAYSLLLKKKDECVNSLHWFGDLFLFERIQQGYDLNPGISVRIGTRANHRIPFMKLHVQYCTIFCRWLS